LHKNLALSIQSWVCAHLDDVFYFQDANEMNGIQYLFTIGIQTPMQLQDMFQFSHKGLFLWIPRLAPKM
jgi:hypothetical protein